MRASRVLVLLIVALAAGAITAVLAPHDPGPASATQASAVAAGGDHSCALIDLGRVRCWGRNTSGQLGNDFMSSSKLPVNVCSSASCIVPLTGAAAITAGSGHTCALMDAGGVKCWGANTFGQIGDGTTDPRDRPTDVSGLTSDATGVSAGAGHTCAVTSGGGVKCWGFNSSGQLGNGTMDPSDTPVDVCTFPVIVPIALGSETGPSGFLLCSPVSGYAQVSAGANHTCAVTTTGGVHCWGGNAAGQLGNGTTDPRTTPGAVCGDITCTTTLTGVAAVSAGSSRTCALMEDGGVKCWGAGPGDGTGAIGAPVDVCADASCAEPLSGATGVSAGGTHSCAAVAGGARCWGSNTFGQLGNGSTMTAFTPVSVCSFFIIIIPLGEEAGFDCLPVGAVQMVAAGNSHTCMVQTTNAVRCWGHNDDGELGAETTAECPALIPLDPDEPCATTPIQVTGFDPKPTPTPTATSPATPSATPTATPPGPPAATATATSPGPPAATPTATPPGGCGVAGDANGDGQVTSVDAALILQFVAGLVPSLPCPGDADVNGDGDVTAVDATLVLQFVAGLLPSL